MSHCHCGLEKTLERFHAKRFGIVGLVLIIGHLLFHVAECLVIPALIVVFSQGKSTATDESVTTNSALTSEVAKTETPSVPEMGAKSPCLSNMPQTLFCPNDPRFDFLCVAQLALPTSSLLNCPR